MTIAPVPTSQDVNQLIQTALQHHRAGQLTQAETLYRQILQTHPHHPDALHMLGVVAHQVGKHEIAIDLIRLALQLNRTDPTYFLNLGLAYQAINKLDDTVASYQQAITHKQNYAEAYNNLGNALSRQNKLDEAINCYQQAITHKQNYAEAYNNLGNALSRQNKLDEAINCYQQALAIKPNYTDAHYNLGHALILQGVPDDAIIHLEKTLISRPDYPEAYFTLGNALNIQGRLVEAVVAYQRAIAIKPDYVEAHSNMGIAFSNQDKLEDAMACLRLALTLKPGHAEAYNNLGIVFLTQGKPDEATSCCRWAIDIDPNIAEAHLNLGNALRKQDKLVAATACFQLALTLKPDYTEAHNNLGIIFFDQSELDWAMVYYQRALAIKPTFADAHLNEGLRRLLLGDLETGWEEYEWRWQKTAPESLRLFPQPRWHGQEDLSGKTLLLYAEQGLGDTLQFCRYAKCVADRGAKVLLEVPPPLKSLLANLAGVSQILAKGEPLPAFDYHCPLLSLPRAFKTTLANIPSEVPYLIPDCLRVQQWQTRFAEAKGLRVGLVWSGNPLHPNDRQRSLSFSALIPLINTNVSFVSLQQEVQDRDKDALLSCPTIQHFGDHIKDFTDTAAIVSLLDLVISVDTAVAHLAGAMGKSVWILLPYMPDWRWLLDREDSPWYPTAKLFRQPNRGDWNAVLQRVTNNLQRLLC